MNRRYFIKSATTAGVILGLMPKSLVASGDEKQNLCPILIDSQGKTITSLAKWKRQRKVIQARWRDYLGILKPNPRPPVLKVIKEDRPEGLVRQLVEYEGEPGITVQG